MKSLADTKDPSYESVNLSIFAIAEVFVGAFTASLPPLRKTFETLLRRVLPSSITGASKVSRQSCALDNIDPKVSSKTWRTKHETDDDSELGILPEEEAGKTQKDADQSILKTTHVAVTEDDRSAISRLQDGWA